MIIGIPHIKVDLLNWLTRRLSDHFVDRGYLVYAVQRFLFYIKWRDVVYDIFITYPTKLVKWK